MPAPIDDHLLRRRRDQRRRFAAAGRLSRTRNWKQADGRGPRPEFQQVTTAHFHSCSPFLCRSHLATGPGRDRNNGCAAGRLWCFSFSSCAGDRKASLPSRWFHSYWSWPRVVTMGLNTCDPSQLAAREVVAASGRLFVNGREISVDGKTRRRVGAKSLELRMMVVAARPAAQHRLRQQRLAPQCHQPFTVEISGVQRP